MGYNIRCVRGRGERRIRGFSRRYNIRCGVILGISVLEEGREDVFLGPVVRWIPACGEGVVEGGRSVRGHVRRHIRR